MYAAVVQNYVSNPLKEGEDETDSKLKLSPIKASPHPLSLDSEADRRQRPVSLGGLFDIEDQTKLRGDCISYMPVGCLSFRR